MLFTISSDYNKYNHSNDKNNIIKSDILNDIGKADGFIFWCNQSALYFGSDRNNPCKYRPVVVISKGNNNNNRIYVAPCTTKGTSNDKKSKFFPLSKEYTIWKKDSGKMSFCYEVISHVSIADLGEQLGAMNQNSRVELFKWLKGKK